MVYTRSDLARALEAQGFTVRFPEKCPVRLLVDNGKAGVSRPEYLGALAVFQEALE